MEALLSKWSGESVLVQYDHPSGAWIFIAIHSSQPDGVAAGGTRMKVYPAWEAGLQDALRLAEAMTYKFAIPNIPLGGGKAVIALPADFDPQHRTGLLLRYGKLVSQLGGAFITGPDVGTSVADMEIIAETAGAYVPTQTSALAGLFTALGVFTGIEVVCRHLFGNASLAGRKVLVQGVGSVGAALIERLQAAGAEILVSDIDDQAIQRLPNPERMVFVPPADVYATACDIFAPCALGGILGAETIPHLQCRAIVGGANNQLVASEDAETLQHNGILYIPDYVINVGGAMGITGVEDYGWSTEQTANEVQQHVQQAVEQLLDLAARENISTSLAARRMAEQSLNLQSS